VASVLSRIGFAGLKCTNTGTDVKAAFSCLNDCRITAEGTKGPWKQPLRTLPLVCHQFCDLQKGANKAKAKFGETKEDWDGVMTQ
jgi:hypothetical protein